MELIDRILSDGNIEAAIHAVKSNRGAAGIDKMTVDALEGYFAEHGKEIKEQIRAKKYQPQPVRRVYIPKANGKQRPLGIPTVVDRVIQQAVAQVLSKGYESYFSEYSYGFRPNRDCHKAIEKVLEYLNEGCEWVVDLDICQWIESIGTVPSGSASFPAFQHQIVVAVTPPERSCKCDIYRLSVGKIHVLGVSGSSRV